MDKKTILAFVLIGLIIILMPYYYKLITPESVKQERALKQVDSLKSKPPESVPAVPVVTGQQTIAQKDTSVLIQTTSLWQDTGELREAYIKVETPLYRAIFSTKGAKLISFRLKKFSDRRGGTTEMIMKKGEGDLYYPNAYMTFTRNNLSTENLFYTTPENEYTIMPGEEKTVVFSASLRNGVSLRNIYIFESNSYVIKLRTEVEGLKLDDEYFFRWDGGVNITELDTLQDLSYSKAYALMGGVLETFDASAKGERRLNPTGKVDWIALRSKYFEIALIPNGNSAGIDFVSNRVDNSKIAQKEFKLAIEMENPTGILKQDYTLYIGPMDSKMLASLNVGLEKTMNWGWVVIKPFSIAVLWSFKLFHSAIPNYGIVIIIFSILIKVILWPLTYKSYESMSKMQKLQPLLLELKEKYKGDAQKLQKETAKLYKEHNVNPLGGCLPVILQMPLLYALFIVFRSTIELRGAPFVLWIKDLSMPDTILHLGFSIPMYGDQVAVLPLIMGLTTYLQSRISMTDPNQKMMLYFMPIFLTLMFNSFPSGLTLYYTLFNIFSMVQQKMVYRKLEEAVAK
jgi:YidC/Oxa1 family membrane protein insertase